MARPLKFDTTTGLVTRFAATDTVGDGVTVAGGAHAIATNESYVAYTTVSAGSAANVATLPAANAVGAGWEVCIVDASGTASSPATAGTIAAAREIQIKPAGADTVEGVAAATNFEVIRDPYGSVVLVSDGISNWTITSVVPHARTELFGATVAGGYRKPLTCKAVKVQVQAAGGGGGSGARNVSGANAAGGSPGSPGGYTEALLLSTDLAATETPTIGAAGTGATAQTSNAASKVGGNGGDASFTIGGTVGLYAQGGRGGPAGASSTTTGGAAAAAVGQFPTAAGVTGADVGTPAAITGNASQGYPIPLPGSGGGAGAYISSVAIDGAAGGIAALGFGTTGTGLAGGTAGSGGGAGGNGPAFSTITGTNQFGGGAGGGGGGGRLNAAAGAGGNGGKFGAGGGGGGGGSGGNGGAGGNGGIGGILVTSYR